MAKGGRKSLYDKDVHPTWAWSLSMEGKTDKEIADAMGITRRTLINWRKEHEEFDSAITNGKSLPDAIVEKSLYERATGYQYTTRRIISTVDRVTGKPIVEKIETLENFAPPDVTAQIYWLKNRRRDKWKDKWDIEVDTDKEIIFNVVEASKKVEENK